eukprot:scaffold14835_cov74-Phaeocystis_antarctica.AAC.3
MHGAAPRPHGTLHSARSPPLVRDPPPPLAPPPRARLRWPQSGPASPPHPPPHPPLHPPPPSEPRWPPPSPPPVTCWQLVRAVLAPRARTLRCCRHQWPSPWVQAWPSSSCPCPSWPPPPSPPPAPPAALSPLRPPWPPPRPPAAWCAAAAPALSRCACGPRPP